MPSLSEKKVSCVLTKENWSRESEQWEVVVVSELCFQLVLTNQFASHRQLCCTCCSFQATYSTTCIETVARRLLWCHLSTVQIFLEKLGRAIEQAYTTPCRLLVASWPFCFVLFSSSPLLWVMPASTPSHPPPLPRHSRGPAAQAHQMPHG